MPADKPRFRGLWFTDFDGTIKPGPDGRVAEADKKALVRLRELGWFRVVATGRSLFGFAKAWEEGLELDALIFSSGLALCPWSAMGPGPLTRAAVFTPGQAEAALRAALELDYGFFAYLAAPDNHHFFYRRPAAPPEGFLKRLQLFAAQCRPWPEDFFRRNPPPLLSQVMMMVPAALADEAEAEFRRLAGRDLSVVRSSSPFGDGRIWLEVFPPGTSKGRAAALLAGEMGFSAAHAVALGNDYNDRDLLAWAGRSFITADAPEELKPGLRIMPEAGRGGLAWALERVLEEDGEG